MDEYEPADPIPPGHGEHENVGATVGCTCGMDKHLADATEAEERRLRDYYGERLHAPYCPIGERERAEAI